MFQASKKRRFVIRDCDTKEVLIKLGQVQEFSNLLMAKEFLCAMNFGLGYFYEVYDTESKQVYPYTKKSILQRGYKKRDGNQN